MARASFSAVFILVLLLATPDSAWSQCESTWSREFAPSWPDGDVSAAVNYDDDGPGPHGESLFLAGSFRRAGGSWVNHIARWDGFGWYPLGLGIGNVATQFISVRGMVTFDIDSFGPAREQLWVCGSFTDPASGDTYQIGRWNGAVWTFENSPAPGTVSCVIVGPLHDGQPALYLSINHPGAAGSVWRWSNGTWTKIGDDLSGPTMTSSALRAMRFYDDDGDGPRLPQLFVAGSMSTTTGAAPLPGIARWNGQSWELFGDVDFAGSILALEVFDADGPGPQQALLVAGGIKSGTGTLPAYYDIRTWNGTSWQSIGTIYNYSYEVYASGLRSIDLDDDGPLPPRLWMTGKFDKIIDQANFADGLAWWDGIHWHESSGGSGWGVLRILDVTWLTGYSTSRRMITFENTPPYSPEFSEGGNWSTAVLQDSIRQLRPPEPQLFSNEPVGRDLIACGSFRIPGDSWIYPAARWTGLEWAPIGGRSAFGDGSTIARIDADGLGPIPPTIVMIGELKLGGSNTWARVAVQLVDNAWIPMPFGAPGTGPSGDITHIEALDMDGARPNAPEFFVSGRIPNAPAPNRHGIARWTGSEWQYVPGRFSKWSNVMTIHDEDGDGPLSPRIYVGMDGNVNIDGVNMNGIARWDGVYWTPLVSPLTGIMGLGNGAYVYALNSHDPDGPGPLRPLLYGGGGFRTIDGEIFNHVGVWDGVRWQPLGAGFMWDPVSDLSWIDDDGAGSRPAMLHASGLLRSSNGVPTRAFARLNGDEWESMNTELLGGSALGRQLVAVPVDHNWTAPPMIWGRGSFWVDGNAFSQSVVRLGTPSPYFSTWPHGQSAEIDGVVALRVSAGGSDPLAYQWRRNGQPLVDGGGINGSTTNELVIASFSIQDAGQYDCVVTNECGSESSPPADVGFCTESATPDINSDGAVNGRDIQAFVLQYLAASTSAASICLVDLNGNHTADASDAFALVQSMMAN